jgi:hypothetical protein
LVDFAVQGRADVTESFEGQVKARFGLTSWIEQARTVIIAVIVVWLVVFSLTNSGWSGRYSIEPIAAPDRFQRSVESSVGTAALLGDDLNKLVSLSGTNVAIKPAGDQRVPEVMVMGATFSLDCLIGKQYPLITGEIRYVDKNSTPGDLPMLCPDLVESKAEVKLVLSVSDDGLAPFFEGEGSFREVVRCGALYALKIIDPYSAASYLGQRPETQPQALKILVPRHSDLDRLNPGSK